MQILDMSVNLGGLEMKNPLTTASGTFASGMEYAEIWADSAKVCDGHVPSSQAAQAPCGGLNHRQLSINPDTPLSCLGAIITKGVSLNPWPGNDGLRIAESANGMLNSIGLQNPGVEAFCTGDLVWLANQDVPVIVNISGHSVAEYMAVVERLESEPAVSAYEINISCPNVDSGGMGFGTDPLTAAEVTAACRTASKRPLIIKLTPNVTDITEVARAVESAGADAISLINTVAGMAVDIHTRRPVFDRVVAGLSGPAIKPIALWAVYRVYQAVKLPLLGIGGIRSAEDVVEFMLAGATAVAIGTANFTDPLTAPKILVDLKEWCVTQGIKNLRELIGALR
jgi:dihydroorotate dehydrogenase (NAD+) catalytic subunit